MTQEEKELLIKDLCARLPYSVFGLHRGEDLPLDVIDNSGSYMVLGYNAWFDLDTVPFKPYLRPLSSMTEEEKKELKSATCPKGTGYFDEQYLICPISHFGEHISYDFMSDILDWLNKHQFDFRNLIGKGLALEAPEGMYK